jgi:hypothetical protein
VGRKLGLLVALFVLGLPASAPGQDTASTALNILPSGQSEDASAPGATREAEMYNALTPLRDNITDAQLPNYFKSEALDPGNTIVRTEAIPGHPGVEIRRDAYDVPHIYGQTNEDVTFGAGYAIRRLPATTSTPSTRSRASTWARAAARRSTTRSCSTACRASSAPPRASTCSRTSRGETTRPPRRR